MRYLVFVFGLLAILGGTTAAGTERAPQGNFIRNGAYADGFEHWQPDAGWTRVETKTGFAARVSVTAGNAQEICTQEYRATGARVRVQVTLKANKPDSARSVGAGYGAFYVRWLDDDYVRLFDDMHILTDNAPPRQWVTRGWSAWYPNDRAAAYLQICARAVAYEDKTFSLAVTDWRAVQ